MLSETSVIRFLNAKKMKPIEIYRQICEFTDKPSYEDLAGIHPDLTPSDFHLSYISSLFLAGKHFNNDKELKENVSNLKTRRQPSMKKA
ncbi:hypothetical protein TNCV_361291 [Trichonephila clavipes]|nr:hypothetical protein TNCV_361291 [Trichonephila clavipes]